MRGFFCKVSLERSFARSLLSGLFGKVSLVRSLRQGLVCVVCFEKLVFEVCFTRSL